MRGVFESAGGREFHYIPALNTRPDHIRALVEVIRPYIPEGAPNTEEQAAPISLHQEQL